jgi:hypothetical protein
MVDLIRKDASATSPGELTTDTQTIAGDKTFTGTVSVDIEGVNLEAQLVPEYMTATTVTGTPASGKFYSDITGRAPILDPRKNPTSRLGIERLSYKGKYELLTSESGPSGEPVYQLMADPRVRLIGKPHAIGAPSATNGHYIDLGTDGDSIEIIFYGTGINVLQTFMDGFERGFDVFIDGVAGSSVSTAGGSTILSSRNYAPNMVIPVVSGLTLGLHTVKLVSSSAAVSNFQGLEIVNESATVTQPEGTITAGSESFTFASDTDDLTTFDLETQDGSGTITDSTKGGAVSWYFQDGVRKKAINYSDSTQLNLTAADHSNETVVMKKNWREFGAGRADDFSTLTATFDDRAFTLDDGTTTLVGDDVELAGGAGAGGMFQGTGSGSYTLTFIGTGLDILQQNYGASIDFYIDGVLISSEVLTTTGGSFNILPIVSGLPFGTHTVKFLRNPDILIVKDFIIYGPKAPELPTGAILDATAYKMADYSIPSVGADTIGSGTLRKFINREFVYQGSGWLFQDETDSPGGKQINSNTVGGSTMELSHFCTGVDFRFKDVTGQESSATVRINGTILNETNFTINGSGSGPAVGVTGIGPTTFNSIAGTFSQGVTGSLDQGAGLSITGLTLDLYSFQIANSGSQLVMNCWDFHTPIYSYSNSIMNTDDTMVGSNTLKTEVLIPGATTKKITALDGIDLGPNKTKWQRKINTTPANSVGVINDLTFNNLTIGKTYRASWHLVANGLTTAGHRAIVVLEYGSGADLTWVLDWVVSGAAPNLNRQGGEFTFVAAQTTVRYYIQELTSGEITGGGGVSASWAELEELPNHIETNEW